MYSNKILKYYKENMYSNKILLYYKENTYSIIKATILN